MVTVIHAKTTGSALAHHSGQWDGALCGSARSAVSMHRVTDQPQQMASATASVGQLMGASVHTQIAVVDAEMAWCSSAGDV